MQRQKYINEITELLSTLETKVRYNVANNLTDLNVHCENFYRDLLNLIFGWRLRNLNSEQQNYPGIDLVDDHEKIAIQITSTSTLEKTRGTVVSFIQNKGHKKYSKLIILNVTKKSKHTEKKIGDSAFTLNTEQDIWDNRDIIKSILNLKTNEIQAVLTFLRQELKDDSTQSQPTQLNQSSKVDRLFIETTQNNVLLQDIADHLGVARSEGAGLIATTQDKSDFNTYFDREIDGYRDLLRSNKPRTALQLFEALRDRLPQDVDSRILFRIKANTASCHLALDRSDEAAKGYLEAYDISPDSIRADTFKVLGLILSGKNAEALKYGIEAQDTTKDLKALVANTIIALKGLPENEHSLDFIPEELQEDKTVLIQKIDFLRSLKNRTKWREEAKIAYQLHPDEETLKRFYAEAILDEGCESRDGADGLLDIKGQIEELNKATVILENCWEEIRTGETVGDSAYLATATNLSTIYRVVDRYDDAIRVIDEALKVLPEDEQLVSKRLSVAFEQNDTKKAAELLPLVPVTRDIALGNLQILFNQSNWEKVCSLPTYENYSDLSENDQAFYQVIQFVAEVRSGKTTDVKEGAQSLLNKYSSQIIIPIVLFSLANDSGDKTWADELYQNAKLLKENVSINKKIMLAEISQELGDYKTVIDLFESIIFLDRDSLPLRLLATAYVNTPITQNAVDFANSISEELLKDPFFGRIQASIYFNHGALDDAQESFENVLQIQPNDASLHMGYLNTLLRKDKKAHAKDHLRKIKLDLLQGPAFMKMGIAQLLVYLDEKEKGLEFGYQVALFNQGDERVVLFYMGLFLNNSSTINIPVTLEKVSDDAWVVLNNREGKETIFVINGKFDRPEIDHYLMDHTISKNLVGKSVGDKVEDTPSLGTKNEYSIKIIKHRYIGLLHALMEAFPRRFPNSNKIYSYTTEEGNVQPILDDIKKFSEAEKQIYDLYIEQKLPLSFLSQFSRHNVIEFASRIINLGYAINTSIGTLQERKIAFKLCEISFDRGIVLDTYTLWFAYTNGLIPSLKKMFARLVVPPSCIDELYEWRKNFEDQKGEDIFTIGYVEGQYIREDITQERLKKSYEYIDNMIVYVRDHIEIIPVAPSREEREKEQELVSLYNNKHALDVAYLAAKENLLLVCEDMSFRTLVKQLFGQDSVWLQAALMYGNDKNILGIEEYSEAVYALAAHQHSFLSLSANVLLSLCSNDQELVKYKKVIAFIGSPSAEIDSHMGVSLRFMQILWKSEMPRLVKCQATSLLLERISVMAQNRDDLTVIFSNLIKVLSPEISNYIEGWFFGHYFLELK